MPLIVMDPNRTVPYVLKEHEGTVDPPTFDLRPYSGGRFAQLLDRLDMAVPDGTEDGAPVRLSFTLTQAVEVTRGGLVGWHQVTQEDGTAVGFPTDGTAVDWLPQSAITELAVQLLSLTKIGEAARGNSGSLQATLPVPSDSTGAPMPAAVGSPAQLSNAPAPAARAQGASPAMGQAPGAATPAPAE